MLKGWARDRALEQEILQQEQNQEGNSGCGQSLCRRTYPGSRFQGSFKDMPIHPRLDLRSPVGRHSCTVLHLFLPVCSGAGNYSRFSFLSSHLWPNNCPAFGAYLCCLKGADLTTPVALQRAVLLIFRWGFFLYSSDSCWPFSSSALHSAGFSCLHCHSSIVQPFDCSLCFPPFSPEPSPLRELRRCGEH